MLNLSCFLIFQMMKKKLELQNTIFHIDWNQIFVVE